MNNSIGFRLKFDDIRPEDIRKFVLDYVSRFERYEIKTTSKLLSSGKMERVLAVSEELAAGKYSLHLPKDMLVNHVSYEATIKFLKLLRTPKTSEIYLVTHIPEIGLMNYIHTILEILKSLPPNYMLLLENAETYSEIHNYINQINDLSIIMEKADVKNFGICLDIGHLLFSAHVEGLTEMEILTYLAKRKKIVKNVREIHIHDYIERPHKQLQKGLMDLKGVSNFIRKNNLDVPIVIESTVDNPEEDGLEQVQLLKGYLETARS